MKRKWLVIGIILLLVGTCSIQSTAMVTLPSGRCFSSKTMTRAPDADSSRGETELKYYLEENLDQVIGFAAPPPVIWQSAIRLTQDEIGLYSDWTMTKVNVAFSAESVLHEIDVRIYIYEKGTTSTKPGPIIVNDTIAHLDTTGVTTIPLVTPVNLIGHEELWVAVEWYQMYDAPGIYYAWVDTLSGPHVTNKSDFIKPGPNWYQLHDCLPEVDGRWGIGAIVEGLGHTELSIGNIKGPVGITADVSNIGRLEVAKNVTWSIVVTGGLLQRVTVLKNGTIPLLAINSSLGIDSDMFFGFGRINIIISAKAENALKVSIKKIAFLVGPFVVGIKQYPEGK